MTITNYYNNESKMLYMDVAEKRNGIIRGSLKRIFTNSYDYEVKYHKDLSEFEWIELMNFFTGLKCSSIDAIQNICSQCKLYMEYVNPQFSESILNPYKRLDTKAIKNCLDIRTKGKKIRTREEILSITKILPNAVDGFILLAIFEGIKGKHLCEFSNLDLSAFQGNIVKLNTGRSFEVSDELLTLAEESAHTYDYFSFDKDKEMHFNMRDKNIVKAMYNADPDRNDRIYRRISTEFERIQKYLDDDLLTKDALTESGMITYIKSLMCKEKDTLENVVRKNRKDIGNRYKRILSVPNFLIDYEECFKNT